MKRILSLMLSMTICSLLFGQTWKSYPIEIGLNDFNFDKIGEYTRITTTDKDYSYSSDESIPELPFYHIRLLVPHNMAVTNVEVTNTGRQLIGKYLIPSNSRNEDKEDEYRLDLSVRYDTERTYPMGKHASFRQASIDGYQVLHAFLSPFEYNAATGELFLKTGISMRYKSESRIVSDEGNVGHNMRDIVSNMVVNPEEMELLYTTTEPITHLYGNYLIITADSLKSAFEPLAETKIYKGYFPYIATIEEIVQQYNYPNYDLAEKIKLYIRSNYLYNSVKYVLLGGDCNIVPTRYCVCENPATHEICSVPTDYYYACLDSDTSHDLFWNANHNSLYGEIADNVDIDAEVLVTRIPASCKDEIIDYVGKRIDYELGHLLSDQSYNNVLFAGRTLGLPGYSSAMSDVHQWGTTMCDTLSSHYNLDATMLYDTGSTLGDTLFSASALQKQLNKEFSIVNVDTHGSATSWLTNVPIDCDENPETFYTSDSIMNINSKGNTLIVSVACNSNDFTNENCLGRTFLRAHNNGTLMYCGGTEKGVIGANAPGSLAFSLSLFHNLFPSNNNVGTAFFNTKLGFDDVDYTSSRWLKYSIQLLGDPEFSLYLSKPTKLNVNAVISETYLGTTLNVKDYFYSNYYYDGFFYVYNSIDSVFSVFHEDNNPHFGIYKGGWIPFDSHRDFCDHLYLQNFDNFDLMAKGEHIHIGSHVVDLDEVNYGGVTINSGKNLNLEIGSELIITDNFSCETGGTICIVPRQ